MKLKGLPSTFVYYAHALLFFSLLPGSSSPFAVVVAAVELVSGHEGQSHVHRRYVKPMAVAESFPGMADTPGNDGGPCGASLARRTFSSSAKRMKRAPRTPSINPNPRPRQASNSSASLEAMRELRIKGIVSGLETADRNISSWLASLDENGKWPDDEVDYTTGCAARRANWPAQLHWRRILTMAAAWHGGLSGTEHRTQDVGLKAAISRAMNYWIERDFQGTACLDKGGTQGCPCENPNNWIWNTNWYSNVILIPSLVGQSCLVLGANNLSSYQLVNGIRMMSRGYAYPGLTGANTLDTSRIGMDQALLTGNVDLLADAYARAHGELKIVNQVREDGIRADGAFAQHDGILYNGNYGKDYANDILGVEIEAAGTEFAADAAGQAAFETQFEGNRWMITRNTLTGVLHWDFSVLGRFISFPVIDDQATGSIKISLDSVLELGHKWNSQPLLDFAKSLSRPTSHANAGNLVGNRNFYTNDYMVQRGQNYVSTIRMWSTRTRHTECTNSQNPFGFHLADGVSYTHIRGDEYEDIAAAWNWDLIPGITTDYGATPLTCQNTKLLGLESFVGGVSDGKIGIATMKYTNPVTKALKWQKAWFFLEHDVQHVMVSGLSSTSGGQFPVFSVLDQRRRRGAVVVDGFQGGGEGRQTYSSIDSLWHGDVGYTFGGEGNVRVTVDVGPKVGNWSAIGISSQPPVTVDLFAAWIEHEAWEFGSGVYPPIAYSVFPGTNYATFLEKSEVLTYRLKTLRNDGHVSAVYDEKDEVFMGVFWDAGGGRVTFETEGCAPVTVEADGNAAMVYRLMTGKVTVADPGQSLRTVTVTVSVGEGVWPRRWRGGVRGDQERGPRMNTLVFSLPAGGLAGRSVTSGF